jgi:hypothetical protein
MFFQPNSIKSLYLNLGIVALTHTNKYIKNNTNNIFIFPINNIDINVHINNIEPYSAKYIPPNNNPPYSIIYPATNSDSASGRSNGGRFVSANAVIIINIHTGTNATTLLIYICLYPILLIFRVPVSSITDIKVIPIDTSYDINCAIDLILPKTAYLELLDQPLYSKLITFKEDIASIYNIPHSFSSIIPRVLQGIGTQIIILNVKVIIGPNI